MAGPPPTYQEALQDLPFALTVRLQVWHYNIDGRSTVNNDRLAELFRSNDIERWEVVPLEVEGVSGPGSHDHYVPVEVQFRHRDWAFNDPGEHPLSAVRRLFFRIAPQFIYQFSVAISSAPHNVNIFPVGVPPDYRLRYTYVYNLLPLVIHTETFFVPGPVGTDDVQSWLRSAAAGAADGLTVLSSIVTAFCTYQQAQSAVLNAAVCDRIRGAGAVPQHLNRLRAFLEQFAENPATPAAEEVDRAVDKRAAFDAAATPFHQYVRLANQMHRKLVTLERGQALSDQDLYELVHDSYNAKLCLSALNNKVAPLVKLLMDEYGSEIRDYNNNKAYCGTGGAVIGGVGVGLGVFLWWNPAGWILVGSALCGGVAGGVSGVGAHAVVEKERGKAFGKKDRAAELRRAGQTLVNRINDAHSAITMLFLDQVLKLKVSEQLEEHFKESTVNQFGVDAAHLSDPDYGGVLAEDRLTRVREASASLRAIMAQVLKDAKIEVDTVMQPR